MSRRKKKETPPILQGRRRVLLIFLLAIIGILLIRAAWLEIFEQEWLQEQADKRQTRAITVPAYRGMIVDRNGEPMAISSPVESLWCEPKKLLKERETLYQSYLTAVEVAEKATGTALEEKQQQALAANKYLKLEEGISKLEAVLKMEPGDLIKRLEKARNKSFFYLGRQLAPEMADEILDLELEGVGSSREYRRFYPLTETAGHVVGMTNIDGKGLEGIEKVQNEVLAGSDGRKRVVRDGRRRSVEDIELIKEMIPGKTVELSIDRRIQYLAYKALMGQVYKLDAKAGSLIVMDAHTGEILAMTNLPSFNPNNRKELKPYRYRNRAASDKFEPGSTLKPLTIAAALEAGVIGPDVEVDTSPGYLSFGKYKVRDPINYGSMTLARILAKSSNVGMSRIALRMEAREQWMFLSRLGFGRVPDSGLAAETAGKLGNYVEWGRVDRASHGYGYGLAASLLQITHAYTPFAAGGKLFPATIYKRDDIPLGRQVMSPETANSVLHMMESVVQAGGTGRRAMVEGYRIAGKTGTAYKYINGKYRKDRYMTSFVGIAPASNPRLVIAVQIDEPKTDSSGGRAAAPVFSKVMAEALRLLDIPPDNLPKAKKEKGQK